MATFLVGIGSSSAWDTSGESIDIKGLDVSSLIGSVVNFEHKSDKTSDYVGKVIGAKKIYCTEDCNGPIELKYWNKCQLPFLFCTCVLFDDYQEAAKQVAAIFKFDEANPNLPGTLGFSVEGSKINRESSGLITHSIARKLSITAAPANKTCVANELKPDDSVKPVSADPLAFLFKSTEIELFKSEEVLEKAVEQPKPPKMPEPPKSEGSVLGQTKSGKDVMSHIKVHDYPKTWTAEDHRNAAVLHGDAGTAANVARNPSLAMHHNQKMQLHNQAAAGLERKSNRLAQGKIARRKKTENKGMLGKNEEMNKALTASGTTASPGNLVGGAALQASEKKKPKLTKTEWLERAEQDYNNWSKKEQFETFMKSRLPNMTLPEIQSMGKTLVLKKSIEQEKALTKMIDLEKNIKGPKDDSHAFLGGIHPNEFKPGKEYKVGDKQMKYIRSTDSHHHFMNGDRDIKVKRLPKVS